MKTKLIVCLVLLLTSTMTMGKKKVAKQDLWPDGTPVSEWFRDTTRVNLTALKHYVVTDYGVDGYSTEVQTAKLQAVIDRAAQEGGGVIVIPRGTFVSGALFFKPGTHLKIDEGGELKGSDRIKHFPVVKTRMEGQTLDYFAALVNADGVDGFTITGPGTINGNGQPYWEEFWIRRKFNKDCTNLEALRPRNVFISNSKNVTVQDVKIINSPFWTNHLYRCENVRYLGCFIYAPTENVTPVDPRRGAPSSDAIDLDVCEDVVVRGCYMNICDDAVCLKGGKGTFVDRDSTAGPVNRVLVEQCRFGHHVNAAVTFGSEAWNCHNVIMRNCQMENAHRLLLFKMRPDTPQQYGEVLVENCTGITQHSVIEASTWTQFYNKQERDDMPVSGVRNVTVRNIDIKTANFLKVDMKAPFTLSNFTLQDIRATDKQNRFDSDKIEGITIKNVELNGNKK